MLSASMLRSLLSLSIIDEYVEITSVDEEETEDFEMEMM